MRTSCAQIRPPAAKLESDGASGSTSRSCDDTELLLDGWRVIEQREHIDPGRRGHQPPIDLPASERLNRQGADQVSTLNQLKSASVIATSITSSAELCIAAGGTRPPAVLGGALDHQTKSLDASIGGSSGRAGAFCGVKGRARQAGDGGHAAERAGPRRCPRGGRRQRAVGLAHEQPERRSSP